MNRLARLQPRASGLVLLGGGIDGVAVQVDLHLGRLEVHHITPQAVQIARGILVRHHHHPLRTPHFTIHLTTRMIRHTLHKVHRMGTYNITILSTHPLSLPVHLLRCLATVILTVLINILHRLPNLINPPILQARTNTRTQCRNNNPSIWDIPLKPLMVGHILLHPLLHIVHRQ